jgi:hypothetical protein
MKDVERIWWICFLLSVSRECIRKVQEDYDQRCSEVRTEVRIMFKVPYIFLPSIFIRLVRLGFICMFKIEVQVSNLKILHLDLRKFTDGELFTLMAKFCRKLQRTSPLLNCRWLFQECFTNSEILWDSRGFRHYRNLSRLSILFLCLLAWDITMLIKISFAPF